LGKIFKVDNNFIPCPVAIGDELFPNGIFVFNITKILNIFKITPVTYLLKK